MTMLSINTNVGALRSADASYSVNKSMETSMNRLSSGKRINSAADDAAGIQIANRMNTEIMGLHQAVRNAADAQALLMTAEGALDEVHTMLLRIRELTVQASNGTLELADRVSLQAEVQVLETEIDRIGTNTEWGGKKLFNGGLSSGSAFTIQLGVDNSQTINISIDGMIDHDLTTASGGLGLSSTVSIASNARSYLSKIDAAISVVSSDRGRYGATINRLDHAISNFQNIATNLATAKGRIEDADFAAETSNLARTQVLQQASMAMLAQANASKQNILSLFQ
jgi:flagellin